ncbi:MAG TPA: hypothetical protein VIU61_22890 [Kofleriaceae bacterium]
MLTPLVLLRHDTRGRAVFSPDGSCFLLAAGPQLVIYSRDGGQVVAAAMPPHGRLKPFVYGMAWASDGAHVAVAENPTLRLRSAADLAIVAESDIRMGPIAFCEGGRALAIGAIDRRLHVLEVPSLVDRGSLGLEVGEHDSFDINHVVADPAGTLVAATDYGGYSDDDWGHTKERGIPKLTLVDAATPTRSAKELSQPQPITDLVLDPWRHRLLVVNYSTIVVRTLDGTFVSEWTPYGRPNVQALAICDRYVATIPDITWGASLTLDLWNPTTFQKLATTTLLADTPRQILLSRAPRFLAASPDGSRLVVPEPDGVRLWSVDAG